MYLEDTDASVDLDLLLVDEYQDLNRADIKLVSEMRAARCLGPGHRG